MRRVLDLVVIAYAVVPWIAAGAPMRRPTRNGLHSDSVHALYASSTTSTPSIVQPRDKRNGAPNLMQVDASARDVHSRVHHEVEAPKVGRKRGRPKTRADTPSAIKERGHALAYYAQRKKQNNTEKVENGQTKRRRLIDANEFTEDIAQVRAAQKELRAKRKAKKDAIANGEASLPKQPLQSTSPSQKGQAGKSGQRPPEIIVSQYYQIRQAKELAKAREVLDRARKPKELNLNHEPEVGSSEGEETEAVKKAKTLLAKDLTRRQKSTERKRKWREKHYYINSTKGGVAASDSNSGTTNTHQSQSQQPHPAASSTSPPSSSRLEDEWTYRFRKRPRSQHSAIASVLTWHRSQQFPSLFLILNKTITEAVD